MNVKKPIFPKAVLYLIAGSIFTGLEQFISSRADTFTDWEFICGMLLGLSIFAYLHAAYYFGVRIRQLREEHKSEK